MEPSPSSPPRTIIVVDDHPSDVSFICSVLDAHALPYAVQVLAPDAPAFDPLAPLAQPASRRAPTLIRLDRAPPPRARQVLWRRLTALWPTVTLPRGQRRWPHRPTAARPSPPRRLRWPRALAWGVSLGLLVGLVSDAPWLWLADRLPRGPLSPPPHSDYMTAALLGPVVPAPPPAAAGRPPAQSQAPVARAPSTGSCIRPLRIIRRWRETRACNDNTCGESKGQNSHESLLDLTCEFIPLSFWYDAPLISRDSDRRHDPWLVYGSPTYSPARWSSWISPA